MLRLLQFMITGDWHLHEWELVETRRLVIPGGNVDDIAIGEAKNCRCKHCGAWKRFDLVR